MRLASTTIHIRTRLGTIWGVTMTGTTAERLWAMHMESDTARTTSPGKSRLGQEECYMSGLKQTIAGHMLSLFCNVYSAPPPGSYYSFSVFFPFECTQCPETIKASDRFIYIVCGGPSRVDCFPPFVIVSMATWFLTNKQKVHLTDHWNSKIVWKKGGEFTDYLIVKHEALSGTLNAVIKCKDLMRY